MKKGYLGAILAASMLLGFSANSHALVISTSGSGSMFGDDYSYLFELEVVNPTNLSATFANTSSMGSNANIDFFAFNTSPDFACCTGGGINITNITPDWTFSTAGNNVQFDYEANADNAPMNANRLAPVRNYVFAYL